MGVLKNLKIFDNRRIRSVVEGYSSSVPFSGNSSSNNENDQQHMQLQQQQLVPAFSQSLSSSQRSKAPPLPIDVLGSDYWNEPSIAEDPSISLRRKSMEHFPTVSGISTLDSVNSLYRAERSESSVQDHRNSTNNNSERGRVVRKAPIPTRAQLEEYPNIDNSLDAQIRRVYKRQQQQQVRALSYLHISLN